MSSGFIGRSRRRASRASAFAGCFAAARRDALVRGRAHRGVVVTRSWRGPRRRAEAKDKAGGSAQQLEKIDHLSLRPRETESAHTLPDLTPPRQTGPDLGKLSNWLTGRSAVTSSAAPIWPPLAAEHTRNLGGEGRASLRPVFRAKADATVEADA
jgi:hypothetical protein